MDSRYQRNICQIVHKCHQIVPQIINKFQKNTNIHVGWAYIVRTCIPLELYTGVHGPTTDVRACILDLDRWSTSTWRGLAARLGRPTERSTVTARFPIWRPQNRMSQGAKSTD
jgi:hypothetical protein